MLAQYMEQSPFGKAGKFGLQRMGTIKLKEPIPKDWSHLDRGNIQFGDGRSSKRSKGIPLTKLYKNAVLNQIKKEEKQKEEKLEH